MRVESELACWIQKDSCWRFVADVAVTYGKDAMISTSFSGTPIPKQCTCTCTGIYSSGQ
jgi:hypothetical protein